MNHTQETDTSPTPPGKWDDGLSAVQDDYGTAVSHPTPGPGQLWSLRWNQITALVVIVWIADTTVMVFPVTTEISRADDAAVLLPEQAGHGDLAVWYGLETGIGSHLLNSWLGDVLPEARCDELHHAFATARPPSRSIYKLGVAKDFSYGNSIAEEFSALGATDWLSILTKGIEPEVAALPRLKWDAVKPTWLARRLGIGNGEAVSILRGDVPLTIEQRDALRDDVEVPESSDILSARMRTLVKALNSPRLKYPLWSTAHRLELDEGVLRASTLMRLGPIAARAQDDEDDRYWDAIVRDYLHGLTATKR